jgi:hypothetical protein
LLARGASRWGQEAWEQVSYGIVASIIPWVIGITPFLVAVMWQQRRRFAAVICSTLWCVFVIYNFVGTTGAIAAVRDDVLSERTHTAGNLSAERATRTRLMAEYEGIPKHRPAGTVAPLLVAERMKPLYESTSNCKDIRRGKEVKFCANITAMESEIASARKAEEVNKQLAGLNASLAAAKPASENADPSARVVASMTGLPEKWIQERLPIATPIVLELGSMTLLYFAGILLGIMHGSAPAIQTLSDLSAHNSRSSRNPDSISRQRELCEWFFAHCVRPFQSGSMSEEIWYEHYRKVCTASSDTPLPLASFRRIAEKYIPTIKPVDGVVYYQGVLPYVPSQSAA